MDGTFDTTVTNGVWHNGGTYTWSSYTPAAYVYHPPVHRATPKPAPRRVIRRPVVHRHHASGPSLGDNAKAVGVGLFDALTGIPSMINDVHTIFGTNAPPLNKIGAGLDLGFNAVSDVLLLTGIGEAMRGVAIGEHVGADLLEHVGEDVAADCGAGLSFLATTVVATRLGEQAIGTLKIGEQVWSYNPTTKKMEFKPILHVWINHDTDLVDLTITHTIKQGRATKPVSEVLHTNKKHPFLTVENGFLPVGQITLGMHIVEANGQTGVVSGWKVVPGAMTMYNLEVAQDHTFVVGVGMWVVHNNNCGKLGDIISNPETLKTMSPDDVKAMAQKENWAVGALGQGSHKGQGLVVREVNDDGKLTGQMIQWHPGGGHHGPEPYWKVSSSSSGTTRIGPQFDNP